MYTLYDKKTHCYKFCEITFIEFLSMLDDFTMIEVSDIKGENKVCKSKASWAGAKKGSTGEALLHKAVAQGVKATKEGELSIVLE